MIGCHDGLKVGGNAESLGRMHLGLGGAGDLPGHPRRRGLRDLLRGGGRLMAGEAARGRHRVPRRSSTASARRSCTRTSTSTSIAARCSASSAAPAPASRCCCARSSGSTGRRRARSRSSASTFSTRCRAERKTVERRWGVMFQGGALFSALTVQQNVEVPMREHLTSSPRSREALAELKIVDGRAAAERLRRSSPPSSPAACRSAPASRARWRSTPRSSSSTSRPLASTRSAPRPSTS